MNGSQIIIAKKLFHLGFLLIRLEYPSVVLVKEALLTRLEYPSAVLVKQALLTRLEYPVFNGVQFAISLVFGVVLCR